MKGNVGTLQGFGKGFPCPSSLVGRAEVHWFNKGKVDGIAHRSVSFSEIHRCQRKALRCQISVVVKNGALRKPAKHIDLEMQLTALGIEFRGDLWKRRLEIVQEQAPVA